MSEPRTYGAKRKKENTDLCIKELFSNWASRQCSRKRGNGPDGLFCIQHANVIQKREEDEVRYKEENEIRKKHGRLLEGDAVFMHALTEMGKEVYNMTYGVSRIRPNPDEWIEDLIVSYLDDARNVRVKPDLAHDSQQLESPMATD